MLSDVKGIGEKTLEIFNKLNINNEKEMLSALPKAYIDMSSAITLEKAIDGDFCLVDLLITEKKSSFKKGKLSVFNVYAENGESKVILTWFNSPYIEKTLIIGETYTVFGKVKIEDLFYTFTNPKFEKQGILNSSFTGILPIYTTKGLISQKIYRNIIRETLSTPQLGSIISEETEIKYKLPTLYQAYIKAHFPEKWDDIKISADRIMIENLVRMIAAFRIAKKEHLSFGKYIFNKSFDKNFYGNYLSFKLTASQEKTVIDIAAVLKSKKPLNGILCGDVGSGKTAVALLLSLYTVDNGYQSAIMAPTEILAKQHFNSLSRMLTQNNKNINIALLTSSVGAKERKEILKQLENGEIDILIGTQSLLNGALKFLKLAFVVLDEQHKFGVEQRTLLLDKGKAVNVLTLSATPIPRSLQLIAYGDIEKFFIESRYCKNIKTAIVPKDKRNDMWKFLYEKCILENGQAYIVAPKIIDCEGLESENVTKLYKELVNIFPAEKLGLLHGKLSSEKKNEIINKFSDNTLSILISTTVIEVGVNIPNANYMVIMQADNFGLAQLHQLRGRVGRNGQKAFCFLYTEKTDCAALSAMKNCNSGMEIAEKDFDMRGCGDIFGLEQSGYSGFKNLTVKKLELAKSITDELNLAKLRPQLKDDIKKFSLKSVSLT